MRKKLLVVLFAIMTALILSFGFSACITIGNGVSGDNGDNGVSGDNGEITSNTVVSSEYYDDEQSTTYRYSYSITLSENDEFVLTTLKVGSDNSYSIESDTGELVYLENGVYQLCFDEEHEEMYIRFKDNSFEFCNRDGSEWYLKKYDRPEGETMVDITPRPGNSTYGYYDLAKNDHGNSMQELYRRLFTACEAFVESDADVAVIDGIYLISAISLDNLDVTVDEAISVWKVFYCENPCYYWLANSISCSEGKLMLCIDRDYATAQYRAECDTAIEQMALDLQSNISKGMSELETSLAIHDYIINKMNYAYEDDGKTPQDAIWAHNMVGCAVYNLGVCESYAKTYQYLCLLNGVNCLFVAGNANGGAHAWNVVEIDGSWYGVDCTWDETNEEKISYSCFGMSQGYTLSTHTEDSPLDKGINYFYELPVLNEDSIQLVHLYKDDVYMGIYSNIDSAFNAMDDSEGNYKVVLFEYELKGILLLSAPLIEHTILSTQTPAVKSITICGRITDLGDGYHKATYVHLNDNIAFNSDFVFNDVGINSLYDLNINSHECRFEGYHYYVYFRNITGTEQSKIVAGCSQALEITAKIEVGTIESVDGERITIRGPELYVTNLCCKTIFYGIDVKTVKIQNLKADLNFDCCKAPDVEIVNIYEKTSENSTGDYIYIYIRGLAGENLPKITVTGDIIDTQIYYLFYGSIVTSVTDMGGEEMDRYSESDSLDENTVLITGINLEMEDFVCVQEQVDKFNSDATICIESICHSSRNVSEIFIKNEKGEFVFTGWGES